MAVSGVMTLTQNIAMEIEQQINSLDFDKLSAIMRRKGVELDLSQQYRGIDLLIDEEDAPSQGWQLTDVMLDDFWHCLPKYVEALQEVGAGQLAKLLKPLGKAGFLPDEARPERSVEVQYSCLPIMST